ncbi:MAG: cupredoxin domain-containing protein [Thaumarchaeota archaeon]|nr:cupredoxin domain-containing protein [Nitrososphaerota archaeon]
MLQLPVDVAPPTVVIWTSLFRYYLFLGTAAAIIVTAWMMYYIFSNRAKNVKEAPKFHEESGWGNWKTVLYTLMVTGTVLGFVEYETFASANLITTPSGDPMTISVTGIQWAWIFTYPNGHVAHGNLTVPQNEIIQLNITSVDVDHSFSIQTMDVAKDALPGVYSTVWFNATNTGVFVNAIRCKELCGIGHATMVANLTVVSQASFNKWYSALPVQSSTQSSSTGAPTGQVVTITIPSGIGDTKTLNFSPDSVSVAPGTTIMFVNQDTGSIHDIDFTSMPPGATVANNPSTNTNTWSGNSFTFTLTTPGTYSYKCDYHGWMTGTITVT